jgi:uncharacterized OB-fold protein
MTTPQNAHPRPAPDADTAPFWDGCRGHRLLLQRCDECATWRFPPRPRCPACRSDRADWREASGRGAVESYTICHPPVLPAFADRAPYDVIVVRLEEGPLIVSNLTSGSPEVGMAVACTFVDIDSELSLPQFRPA